MTSWAAFQGRCDRGWQRSSAGADTSSTQANALSRPSVASLRRRRRTRRAIRLRTGNEDGGRVASKTRRSAKLGAASVRAANLICWLAPGGISPARPHPARRFLPRWRARRHSKLLAVRGNGQGSAAVAIVSSHTQPRPSSSASLYSSHDAVHRPSWRT
ncbi:hypothetical protein BU26DRAFT_510199 [Trematosphaeria pertusa]|uniref:Uncharacterized protein n=1 Tax=Trematosphaeria pertusa TaxID=390896 RepID=A0A6A6HY96_9PLEO|nr:uncharacterized protein BU26DRAFT_510199 [Trematosphaeria pertusa]KAF2242987.1 hypothetical protein BU26DRAFT_510199 [Trematosphaeria pertusa]